MNYIVNVCNLETYELVNLLNEKKWNMARKIELPMNASIEDYPEAKRISEGYLTVNPGECTLIGAKGSLKCRVYYSYTAIDHNDYSHYKYKNVEVRQLNENESILEKIAGYRKQEDL